MQVTNHKELFHHVSLMLWTIVTKYGTRPSVHCYGKAVSIVLVTWRGEGRGGEGRGGEGRGGEGRGGEGRGGEGRGGEGRGGRGGREGGWGDEGRKRSYNNLQSLE